MNDKIEKEVITLKPFKRFCMTIGELPSSYLETMTYYEMLVWFTKYMQDTIIPTINNNGEAVSELQNLFVELQTYVNDYFDNLDVQEEINNKLDDMVEQGTLQEIIADYLNSKAIFGFDTVNDMKESTNLIDGSYVQTLGYYSKNDGGSALYKITESQPATDYYEELDSGLYAILIIKNNTINIKQLGANSINDIGNIINGILNKNIKVYVPNGEYNVSTTINPPNYSKIQIDGTLNNSSNNDTIKIENNYIDLYVEKIVTTGNGLPILIESNTNTTKCYYNRITIGSIDSSTHGIYMHAIKKGIVYNIIDFKNIRAGDDYYGIFIKTENDPAKSYVNENTIKNGKLSKGLYGIYIDTDVFANNNEVNGMHFDNIVLEGVTNGVYMNNARNNVFNYPRTGEISNIAFKLAGLCDANVFNTDFPLSYQNIDVSEIDITSTHDATFNYFNGYVTDGSGGRIGKDLITYGRQLFIRELIHKTLYIQITDTNLDENKEYHIPNNRIGNYFRISTNDADAKIYLNQYYGSIGIDEIFIQCRTDHPFKLYDYNNNLLIDWDGTQSPILKHLKCRYIGPNEFTENWFEVV